MKSTTGTDGAEETPAGRTQRDDAEQNPHRVSSHCAGSDCRLPDIGGAILSSGIRVHGAHRLPCGHDQEAPAIRDIPHYQYPAWASYDGQFYAQRALDPLVRDPARGSRHGPGALSRPSHSLQLDGVWLGLGQTRLDSRSVRASERRRLVAARLAADPLAAVAHRSGACSLGRLSLFAWPALVGPLRAPRRPEPAAHALSPFSARKQGRPTALGVRRRRQRTRSRD